MPQGSIRAILAVILTCACIGLAVVGKDIPDTISTGTGLVWGLYFRERSNGGGT